MSQYARPSSDVSSGSWTASSGSDLYAMVDEETYSDTDFMQCLVTSTCELGLSSVNDPADSTDHIFKFRAKRTLANGSTLTVSLKQGTTTIATRSAVALTSTTTEYSYTLSSGEADNITDYSNLRLYFNFNKSGAGGGGAVSWAEFSCNGESSSGYGNKILGIEPASIQSAGGTLRTLIQRILGRL